MIYLFNRFTIISAYKNTCLSLLPVRCAIVWLLWRNCSSNASCKRIKGKRLEPFYYNRFQMLPPLLCPGHSPYIRLLIRPPYCVLREIANDNSLAAQPLAKNGGSGNTAILKLFCRNAINNLRGWWKHFKKLIN